MPKRQGKGGGQREAAIDAADARHRVLQQRARIEIVPDTAEGEVPELDADIQWRRDEAEGPPRRGEMPEGEEEQRRAEGEQKPARAAQAGLRAHAVRASSSEKRVLKKVLKSGSARICCSSSMCWA